MAANTWLVKLNVLPDVLCRCGHAASQHLHGKSCTQEIENFKFCKCEEFREAKSEQEIIMAKAKNGARKKSEGRTPTLAPYAKDNPFKIYMNHDGKEHQAMVLTSGIIRLNDKDYTSPSSAGQAILGKNSKGKPLQVDGWKSWYFNKDGERVMLNTLRGSKSPLTLEAPKREKKAKVDGPAKPKRARKSRKPRGEGAISNTGDGSVGEGISSAL